MEEDLQRSFFELGELLGEEILFSEHEGCRIIVNDTISVDFTFNSYDRILQMAAKISAIAPGKFRENVLKMALKSNYIYLERKSYLAYVQKDSALALIQNISLENLTGELLFDHLEGFTERALKWKEAIDSGQPSPPPPEVPEGSSRYKPPLFGIS